MASQPTPLTLPPPRNKGLITVVTIRVFSQGTGNRSLVLEGSYLLLSPGCTVGKGKYWSTYPLMYPAQKEGFNEALLREISMERDMKSIYRCSRAWPVKSKLSSLDDQCYPCSILVRFPMNLVQ